MKSFHLEIPAGPFNGYIFDCDGTLADTMPIHHRAWIEALREEGIPFFNMQEFLALGGTTNRVVVEHINARWETGFEPLALARRQEEIYLEKLDTVRPIETVVAHARLFKSNGMPVAVASGAVRPIVEKTLELIGLGDFFPVLITPERAVRHKPFPDMFLLAAQEMTVEPSRTLVFEDADFGIQAAAAAGMASVRVPIFSIS